MKNTIKWFGTIALVAVIGFSMAACGGGGGGGGGDTVTYTGMTDDGAIYTLKITKGDDDARYTAKEGDIYELILTLLAGPKTSAGLVESFINGILTLAPFYDPDTTFTAAVSASGLTALKGTITWEVGEPTDAPGELTGIPQSSGGGGGSLGNSLNLSGPVYIEDMEISDDYSDISYVYKPYTGQDITFTSNVGGAGSIRGGNLSFIVGTPPDSSLEPFETAPIETGEFGDIYADAKVTPSNTRGVSLDFSDIDLAKENMIMNMGSSSFSMTMEYVVYIYVDRDCNITATGGKISQPELGVQVTVPNLNLKLSKGWNTISMSMKITSTNSTVDIKTGDLSSCKWVIGGYGYGYGGGYGGGDYWDLMQRWRRINKE